MKCAKFEAFVAFEDLGFEDYIINTKLNVKGKIFPNSKKTAGDLLNLDLPTKNNLNDFKIYKNISVLCEKNLNDHYSESVSDVFRSEIITQNRYIETKVNSENDKKIDLDEVANKITEAVIDKIKWQEKNENAFDETNDEIITEHETVVNENKIYNESVENFNTQQTNLEENSITNILQNQINQSNAYTIEQSEMLEENINVLNNNVYVNITQLENTEKKLVAATEEIKREIKNDIKETKDYFKKFLNS